MNECMYAWDMSASPWEARRSWISRWTELSDLVLGARTVWVVDLCAVSPGPNYIVKISCWELNSHELNPCWVSRAPQLCLIIAPYDLYMHAHETCTPASLCTLQFWRVCAESMFPSLHCWVFRECMWQCCVILNHAKGSKGSFSQPCGW